jgi:hypothetical protein
MVFDFLFGKKENSPYEGIEETPSELFIKPREFYELVGHAQLTITGWAKNPKIPGFKRDFMVCQKWLYDFFGSTLMEDWLLAKLLLDFYDGNETIARSIVSNIDFIREEGWKDIAISFAAAEYLSEKGERATKNKFRATKNSMKIVGRVIKEISDDEIYYYQLKKADKMNNFK